MQQGRPIATDWAFGIDAVSAALMAETIQNEYLTSASLGANTDWVVTFPTKQFYVDDLYGSVPFPPFVDAFHAPGISTVTMVATHFDREEGSEQQPPACDQTGCMAYPPLTLGYEVNVLSYVEGSNLTFAIGTPSRVLGSVLTYSALDPFGEQGFTTADLTVGDGGHILPGGVDVDGNDVARIRPADCRLHGLQHHQRARAAGNARELRRRVRAPRDVMHRQWERLR